MNEQHAGDKPETLEQARTWAKVKNAYVRDGFCDHCAARAAYGHQIGFGRVEPACTGCTGKHPSYRFAGEHALRWAGETAESSAPDQTAQEAA